MVGFGWFLGRFWMEFRCAFERIFEQIFERIFRFFVGHNLLMTIDSLLMLKKFWGILPLLNYF